MTESREIDIKSLQDYFVDYFNKWLENHPEEKEKISNKIEKDEKCMSCHHLPKCLIPKRKGITNFCRVMNYFFYINIEVVD